MSSALPNCTAVRTEADPPWCYKEESPGVMRKSPLVAVFKSCCALNVADQVLGLSIRLYQ